MAEAETSDQPRRRRSRRTSYSRRRGKGFKFVDVLRGPGVGRAINIGVGIIGVAYLGLCVAQFKEDSNFIGFRPLGAPRSEVLYGYNRPTLVRNGSGGWTQVTPSTDISSYETWRFPSEGGGTFQFHFDGAGISDEVSCFHTIADPGACPSLFGVRLGDLEDKMTWDLGAPTSRVLSGTSGLMLYPSLGLEYELQEYKVRRLTIRNDRKSVFDRIPRLIRFLIP